ncbi:DUF805 domain-containing protein [Rhodovulum sp. DZ06]|uniref:DUF805 domain-containing protein n=1 Tax=Rhodovulum sp. DZ06 TaxID=3425126 RepID=UPI003D33D5C5
MMSFGAAIRTCLSKYVTFSGRAPRAEFWWFMVFTTLGSMVLQGALGAVAEGGSDVAILALSALTLLWSLGLFLPSLAVTSRRLHDVGRSFWWYLLIFVPLIGMIVLLVWFCSRSKPEANRWGPPPYGLVDTAETFA